LAIEELAAMGAQYAMMKQFFADFGCANFPLEIF
jgi:hypothetical protein